MNDPAIMPTLSASNAVAADLRTGTADIGDKPNCERGPRQDAIHGGGRRVFIRPFAAEEISERKINEDQADDAGPDQIACAEDIADKASGGKFGGECGHAGDEDCKE